MKDEPPAPTRKCKVHPGGNGDQFIVFGDAQSDDRHIELLNKDDARKLHRMLGESLSNE